MAADRVQCKKGTIEETSCRTVHICIFKHACPSDTLELFRMALLVVVDTGNNFVCTAFENANLHCELPGFLSDRISYCSVTFTYLGGSEILCSRLLLRANFLPASSTSRHLSSSACYHL